MTTLYVLGSGSKGNCFALETEGVSLLIDAGFSAREIARRAEQVGLDLAAVCGIALSHEHGDHAAGAPVLSKKLGVPILSSPGTWHRLQPKFPDGSSHDPVGFGLRTEAGPFLVEACLTSHDALEPLALVIRAPDGVSLGVACDIGRPTAALRYMLRDMTALVVEANHDEVRLRTSGYPATVRQRIAGSAGHLSNRAAAELLVELLHPGLRRIVLAHLSESCNTAEDALETVEPVLREANYSGFLDVALQHRPLTPMPLAPGADPGRKPKGGRIPGAEVEAG